MKFPIAAIASLLALPLMAGEVKIETPLVSSTRFDISRFIDVLTVRAVHSFGMELDNSPAEFDFTELNLTAFLTKPISLGGDWGAIAYLNLNASRINFDSNPLIGPVASDIETDLYRVSLPFVVYNTSSQSPWTYGAWVNPAISSDFANINSDAFFLDAAVAVAYQLNEQLLVGAGVFASDILNDPFVIPGVGFAWTPTEDWLVSFYGPRFVARRDINHRNQVGFEVATNGGNWNIDSGGNSLKLNLRSWRSGIYYRYNITGELWLQAAAGFTFANQLNLETREGSKVLANRLGDAEAAPYAFIGLSVARW